MEKNVLSTVGSPHVEWHASAIGGRRISALGPCTACLSTFRIRQDHHLREAVF